MLVNYSNVSYLDYNKDQPWCTYTVGTYTIKI